MAVSTSTNKISYAGNGTTNPLAVPFKFFENSDIDVIQTDSLGAVTTLTENTDYSLTGAANDNGGTLTPLVTFAIGTTWTIVRTLDIVQETDLVENDPLPAETLERAFDRGIMIAQQLDEKSDRAVTLPISSTASGELPTPVGNAYLGWKSDGSAIENKILPAGTAVYSTIANTRLGSATGEAVTPDSLASLWQEGQALVSAASITKPIDANLGGYYTQSGNTGTNSYWAGSVGGEEMEIRYTGTPLLGTSGNLLPPGGNSFQVIAGAVIRWRWDASASKWRAIGGANADGTPLIVTPPPLVPVRQTVLNGPVDTNGLPNFGGSTGSTTVTASGTLRATAANGFNAAGQVDRVGSITNPSWTGLSINGTMYLYLDIAADGTCTPGSTTVQPVYRPGGADVVTANQFTFNWQEMVGKVGNGTTAVQAYRVFVGEVTVASNVVSAITWYALQGRCVTPLQAFPANGALITFNHNLGVTPLVWSIALVNLTAQGGYSPGQEYPWTQITSSASLLAAGAAASRLTATCSYFTVSPSVITSGAASVTAITAANWNERLYAIRGW